MNKSIKKSITESGSERRINLRCLISLNILFLVLASSCSTNQGSFKRREVLEKGVEYSIVNAAQPLRPIWLKYPHKNRKNLPDRREGNLYFSFESGPKISKEIACNIVRVFASDDFAERILKFYLSSKSEDELSLEIQTILATDGLEVFKRNFKSSRILLSYWEARLYPPKIGDTEEIEGYTCGLWVEVSEKLLVGSLEEIISIGKERFPRLEGWQEALTSLVEEYRLHHFKNY